MRCDLWYDGVRRLPYSLLLLCTSFRNKYYTESNIAIYMYILVCFFTNLLIKHAFVWNISLSSFHDTWKSQYIMNYLIVAERVTEYNIYVITYILYITYVTYWVVVYIRSPIDYCFLCVCTSVYFIKTFASRFNTRLSEGLIEV